MLDQASPQERAAAAGDQDAIARLRAKKPIIRTVRVPLDPALADELQAAKLKLGNAEIHDDDQEAAVLRGVVDELEAAVAAASVTLKFRSIGRVRYEALVREHPPIEAEQADYAERFEGRKLIYSLETFPPALVAASSFDPEIPLADAVAWYAAWNDNEFNTLFAAAIDVNLRSNLDSLGKG